MKKSYQAIYSKDWMAFHPYQASAPTDLYYIQLANRVYAAVSEYAEAADVPQLEAREERVQLSCILTCYFEDVIAQAGLFKAFTAEHARRYGKPLPFYYESDEYVADEINTDDVRFLVWHFFVQMCDGDLPSSPADVRISGLAEKVMEIFDAEYETAPENKKLKEFFDIPADADLYALQAKFFWLGTESYLFFSDGIGLQSAIEASLQQVKESDRLMDIPAFVNIMCNDFAYNNVTELLGLSSAAWLAIILGEKHPLYKELRNMSRKYSGYFTFEGETASGVRFKHVVSGTEIEVPAKSMTGFPKELKTDTTLIHLGFVKWNGQWWLVGQVNGYKKNPEMLKEINGKEEEKNLFADSHMQELPEEEQTAIFERTITDMDGKENIPADELPLCVSWDAVCNPELSRSFVKKMYGEGKLPDFRFAGADGKKLVDSDFEFLMDYFKAD